MKFNLEFEFEDLEFDEGSISQQLQNSIQNQLVYKLKEGIKQEVFDAISMKVRDSVLTTLGQTISERIKEVVDTGEIKQQYSTTPVTIQQFIEDAFNKTDIRKSLESYIEKQCKVYVEQIKKSYDMAFAAHIVKNMQQNNLLKEGVADLLFDKTNQP